MAGIYSQGGSAGHRYAGWLSEVEAKNFIFGGKVFNGSPSAIYVGSNQVWPWLTIATQQAILGAFLDDGMAVIIATNAYLNQLAASGQAGKDKATALAGFINEDPMMVCSLGLQPDLTVLPAMPIRFLKNTGDCYMDTGYKPSSNTGFDVEFYLRQLGTRNVLGCREGWISKAFQLSNYTGHNASGSLYFGTHPYVAQMNTLNVLERHILKNRVYTNGAGTQATLPDEFTQSTRNIMLFAAMLGDANRVMEFGVLNMSHCFIYEGDNLVRWMYPWISNGTNGMIDVLTGTFYPNLGSGSFSEEYQYYQNGQWVTWTPSTP